MRHDVVGKTSPWSHCSTSKISQNFNVTYIGKNDCGRGCWTYVLDNTSRLPSEPINDCADPAGIVIEKSLRIYVCRLDNSDISRAPDGPKNIKSGIRAVISERVMVLSIVLGFGATTMHCMWLALTIYVEDMNSKAAVRFFVTRNSLAKVLKRCSVSAAVGGGSIASQGAGVTTDCLAAMTLVGGFGMLAAGTAKAGRTTRKRLVSCIFSAVYHIN